MKKQIFVMGGGGFTKDPYLKLERYMLSLSDKKNPKISFLPQASSESRDYIAKFYESFIALGAHPSWISLFGRVDQYWKDNLLNQDIIYVGGGNTRSMLALWREWGMDQVLVEAYHRGIILAGLSAGMSCWFKEAVTGSVYPFEIIKGLNLINASACPHFDTQKDRQNFYVNSILLKDIMPGYGLSDNTGALFVEGAFQKAVSTEKNKKVHFIAIDTSINLAVDVL